MSQRQETGGHDFDRRESSLEEVRKKLRSGWRHDPDILEQYFKACYNNWKVYTGARTPKQVLKLQAIYKQAVYGDNEELPPDEMDSVEGEKWKAWAKLKGTSKEIAKRRFITFLAEIDPLLIDVMPDEKPPIGFPLDRRGNVICAKCNTVVGCIRPILDHHKMPLKQILFDNEEFHEPEKLKTWIRTALANQRCVWGIHMPITRAEAKPFMDWFGKDENRGFYPYDSAPIMSMVKEVVTNYHQMAQEMMGEKDTIDTDAYNAVAIKCYSLKDVYESFSGEDYKYEVFCTRDNESCNQRRIADGGKNHMHEFIIDPPTKMDVNIMEEAIMLRKQCQRLGINPSTGVVKSLQDRCEIYRQRIAEHFAALKRASEAKTRNDNRAVVHKTEKETVIALSKEMLQRQMWDACQENLIDNIMVLAKRGGNVNEESPRGLTPMLTMIINEAVVEKIELLINTYSADINQPNKYGMTPLMMACRMKDMKMVHVLMRNGASALQKGYNGQTALHTCAIHGSEEIARTIVDYLRDGVGDAMRVTRFVDAMDDNGDSALIIAARRRNGIMCYTLCSLGCNPGIRNSTGRTAAYVARSKTWNEICDWLDKKVGTGANRIETFSDLEFEKKCRFGLIKTRELLQNFARTYLILIQNRLGLHPLGTPYKSKSMINERGDRARKEQRKFVNNHFRYILGRFPEQYPSLMAALPASYHSENHQDHLLTDEELEEKLNMLRSNLAEMLSLIRQGYTNPNIDIAAHPIAWTPMMCAVALNDSRSIKILYREGGDPNYPNKDGTTPVMLAAQLQHNQALIDLLSIGGDLQILDNMGFSPLAYSTSLPLPTIMDRSYVDIMTNDDVGGPKILSSEDVIKAALLELPDIDPSKEKERDRDRPTGKIGGSTALQTATDRLKELLMRNEQEASPENVETQSKFLQLLHLYGLTPIREVANVDHQLKSAKWRMVDKPDESDDSYNRPDSSHSQKVEEDDFVDDTFGDEARRKYEEEQERIRKEKEEHLKKMDPNVLRCPICTLTPPCPHFFKIDSLLSYIKKNASVQVADNSSSLGPAFRMSRKVKTKNRMNEVLEETELDDRETDRSATLAKKYQQREEYLEKMRAHRLADDARQEEEEALEAADLAAFEEEMNKNSNDKERKVEELFELPSPISSAQSKDSDQSEQSNNIGSDSRLTLVPFAGHDEVYGNLPGSAGGLPLTREGEFTPEMSLAIVPISILKQVSSAGHSRRVRFNLLTGDENQEDSETEMNTPVAAEDRQSLSPDNILEYSTTIEIKPILASSETENFDTESQGKKLPKKRNKKAANFGVSSTDDDKKVVNTSVELVPQKGESDEDSDADIWFEEKKVDSNNNASDEVKLAYEILTTGKITTEYKQKQLEREQREMQNDTYRIFPFNRDKQFGFQDGVFADVGQAIAHDDDENALEADLLKVSSPMGQDIANRKVTLPGYLFQHLTDMNIATLPPVSMSLSQTSWIKILESLNNKFHSEWSQEVDMSVLIDNSSWAVTAPTCILCHIGYIRSRQTLQVFHNARGEFDSAKERLLSKLYSQSVSPDSTESVSPRLSEEEEASMLLYLCMPCLIRRELFHSVLRTQPRAIRRTLHSRWPLLATHDPQFNHMSQDEHVDERMNPHPIAPLPKQFPPLGLPASSTALQLATPLRQPISLATEASSSRTALFVSAQPIEASSSLMIAETAFKGEEQEGPTDQVSSPISHASFLASLLKSQSASVDKLQQETENVKNNVLVSDEVGIINHMDDILFADELARRSENFSLREWQQQPNQFEQSTTVGNLSPGFEGDSHVPSSPIKSETLRELDAMLERHMHQQLSEWAENGQVNDAGDDVEDDDVSQVSSLSQVSVSYEKNWMLSVLNNLSGTASLKDRLLAATSSSSAISSHHSVGTSVTVSTISRVNPFKRPRELTLLPYYIAQGLFEDSERLIRILLGKPAIDEGEGHAFLVEVLLQAAESYKLCGLYVLSLSMYLDLLTRTIALTGWFDRLTNEVCLPSLLLCFRRMGLDAMAQSFMKEIMQDLHTSLRKNGRKELIKKLQQIQRANATRFVKINSLWTKHLHPRLFLPSETKQEPVEKGQKEEGEGDGDSISSGKLEKESNENNVPMSRHHSTSNVNETQPNHHLAAPGHVPNIGAAKKWHRFERLLGVVGVYVFYTSTLPVFVTHRKLFREFCHSVHRQFVTLQATLARWQRQRERVLKASSSTGASFDEKQNRLGTQGKHWSLQHIDAQIANILQATRTSFPLKYESATTYQYLNIYADFLDLYFTIFQIEDPVVYRYLLQHLWRQFLSKSHATASPLPQLFRKLASRAHLIEIAYFFRFGKELALSIFDPLVSQLLQELVPIYRRFFLHAEAGASYRELFLVTLGGSHDESAIALNSHTNQKEEEEGGEEGDEEKIVIPAVAEAVDQAAMIIQSLARAYLTRRQYVFGPALRKRLAEEARLAAIKQAREEADAAAAEALVAQEAELAQALAAKKKRPKRFSVVLPDAPVLLMRSHY